MQTPLQLTFRSMDHSDALAAHVRQRADRLEHLFGRVVSCHVVIELSGHHHSHGDRYRFSINVGLPGHEVLVTHAPRDDRAGENAYAAADRAFDDVERQIEHWAKNRRQHRHDVLVR